MSHCDLQLYRKRFVLGRGYFRTMRFENEGAPRATSGITLKHQVDVHLIRTAVGFERIDQTRPIRHRRRKAAGFLVGKMVAIAPGVFDILPAQQVIALVKRIRRKAQRRKSLAVRRPRLGRQSGIAHEAPQRNGYAAAGTHRVDQPVQHAHAQIDPRHVMQKTERHGHIHLRRMMQLAQRRARNQTAYDIG